MPRLVTRAEFARIAGISAMSITRACRTRLVDACVGPRLDLDHPAALAYVAERGRASTAAAETSSRPPSDPTPPPPPPPVLSAAASSSIEELPPPPPPPAAALPPPPPPPEPPLEPKPQVSVAAAPPSPPAAASPPSPAPLALPNPWDRVDVEQYADWTLRQIADQFGTVTAFKDWLDARKKQVSVREKELKNWEAEGMLIPRDAVRTHVFGHIDGVNRRLLQDVPKTIARRVYALARSDTPVEDAERLVREILSSELRPMKERVARTLREAR